MGPSNTGVGLASVASMIHTVLSIATSTSSPPLGLTAGGSAARQCRALPGASEKGKRCRRGSATEAMHLRVQQAAGVSSTAHEQTKPGSREPH